MAEVGFYHLTRSPLEEALPRLLEKAYATGQRALVRVGGIRTPGGVPVHNVARPLLHRPYRVFALDPPE